MKKYVYMKVTKDIYELPIAIADTQEELAKMVGTTKKTIQVYISNEKRKGEASPYKKVNVEDID